MRKAFVKLCLIFAAALLCIAVGAPALVSKANSAQTYWTGVYSTGALTTDDTCPVVVESELLTFDLQQFPSNYYESAEEFLEYDGKVTAQYTFYNPADYTVEMTLAFPYGGLPSYGSDFLEAGYGDYYYDYISADDTGKYAITSDGEEIEKTVRHTYSTMDYFNTEEDLAKLCDGFKEDDFFSPDTTIYEYVVRFYDLSYKSLFVTAEFDSAERRVFSSNSSYSVLEKGGAKLGWWADEGDSITIYSTDTSPENLTWNFYTTGAEKTKAAGKAEIESRNELTFKQFALEDRSEQSSVSETDWYNAVVDMINEQVNWGRNYFDISLEESYLMRWYVYTLTIEPYDRVVNEVTAPIYPAIDLGYDYPVCLYNYLLSPAQTWADFGSLEIRINTQYYIVDDILGEFRETEYGYVYVSDGLPDSELLFALSASSEKHNIYRDYYDGQREQILFVVLLVVLAVLPVLVPVVTLVVLLAMRSREKSRR